MSALVVQAASVSALHCFVSGGGNFDIGSPAWVMGVPGVRRAYLVTTRRAPEQWCLVICPELAVEPENARQLHELVVTVAWELGCVDVHLHAPVERGGYAHPVNLASWLKW